MALIRLEHVSKSFGDRIALSDVTLSFDPGEWVFVLGPSGAGKSTLLRLLALAEKPSQGRVELDPDAVSSPMAAPSAAPEASAAAGEPDPGDASDGDSSEAPARRRSPKRVPLRRVRRLVGVLGQEFRLLGDRSIYENIALACQISGIWDRARIQMPEIWHASAMFS